MFGGPPPGFGGRESHSPWKKTFLTHSQSDIARPPFPPGGPGFPPGPPGMMGPPGGPNAPPFPPGMAGPPGGMPPPGAFAGGKHSLKEIQDLSLTVTNPGAPPFPPNGPPGGAVPPFPPAGNFSGPPGGGPGGPPGGPPAMGGGPPPPAGSGPSIHPDRLRMMGR